jgi:hypothetical protein
MPFGVDGPAMAQGLPTRSGRRPLGKKPRSSRGRLVKCSRCSQRGISRWDGELRPKWLCEVLELFGRCSIRLHPSSSFLHNSAL